MKFPLFGLLLPLFLLTGCGGGGSKSPGSTSAPDVKALASAVRGETNVPALAGAYITSRGINFDAVGLRRLGQSAPVTRNDLFHIGSCTKSVTATLAGRLVEAGKIRFETTLAEAFPDLTIHPDLRGVTLRQLLGHRSGLAGYDFGEELLGAAQFSGPPRAARRDFARFLLAQKPAFAVGTFNYSNAGYGVAGAMLEQAANDSWENLIKTQVFSPLGVQVKFGWPATGNPNQPWGHLEEDGEFSPNDPNDPANPYNTPIPALAPAGIDVSLSSEGLARYVQSHLRGLRGQNTLLNGSTFTTLHTPVASNNTYSQGWDELSVDGVKISIHDGSLDPFFAVMAVVPSRDQAAIALSNTGGTQGAIASYRLVGRLLGIANFEEKIGAALGNATARRIKNRALKSMALR